MKTGKIIISAFILNFLLISGVFASVIEVPGDEPDIQSGINAASSGDTVLIADGIYTGSGNRDLDFQGKDITVMSENGPDACIIDCEYSGRGFYFHSFENEDSILQGITIRHGSADQGGGIYCSDAAPVIINCVFTENSAFTQSWGGGGGLFCWQESSIQVIDCTITSNSAEMEGGGIYFHSDWGHPPSLINCDISSNVSGWSGGGMSDSGHSNVENCDFSDNHTVLFGGGIDIDSCNTTVVDCRFYGNTASEGGGIYVINAGPDIMDCDIFNNYADSGGGVYSDVAADEYENCTIWNNNATDGGGFFAQNGDWLKMRNCLILNNTAENNGGGLNFYHGGGSFTNITVTGNTAETGGSVYCNAGSPAIENSILWGNTPDEIHVYSGSPVINNCDVQGGYPGMGNLNVDPLFTTGPGGDFYLSCTAAGQPADSLCIDAGDDQASNVCLSVTGICMDELTTRTDAAIDSDLVDLGMHYALDAPTPTPSPIPTSSPTPTTTSTPTASATLTPSITPTTSPTITPTASPIFSLTPTSTHTPTIIPTATPTWTQSPTSPPSFTPTITQTSTSAPVPSVGHSGIFTLLLVFSFLILQRFTQQP